MTTIEKLGYVYIEECVYSSLVCVSNETKLVGFSDTVQTLLGAVVKWSNMYKVDFRLYPNRKTV